MKIGHFVVHGIKIYKVSDANLNNEFELKMRHIVVVLKLL